MYIDINTLHLHINIVERPSDRFSHIVTILVFKKSKTYVPLELNLVFQTEASTSDIIKIIKSLNAKETKRPHCISTKFVKISANVINCQLANIIKEDISWKKTFKTVKSIFKKVDKAKIRTINFNNKLTTSTWKCLKLRRQIVQTA